MPPLRDRQAGFGAALLDPDAPVPEGLVGPDGRPSPRRFAVYRNNVVSSLIDALAEAYPVVQRLVGEQFFRAAARLFVTAHPPDSPVLLGYGAGFATFLDGFPPLADYPYIGDVARIERAWLDAYHAPDAAPITQEALAATAPEYLPMLGATLHPSCRIVASDYPAGTIWQANTGEAPPGTIDLTRGETVLLARPDATVELRLLSPGPARFLLALAAGNSLTEAAETALRAAPDLDIGAALAGLIGLGLLTDLRPVGAESRAELPSSKQA